MGGRSATCPQEYSQVRYFNVRSFDMLFIRTYSKYDLLKILFYVK